MPGIGQIQGMLLEEAILFLLRVSGYRPVWQIKNKNHDTSLKQGKSGLEIKGRGGSHQIDAIADFVITQPFSNPQRLLLEAKCYRNKVGIEVVRNAIGVLKDVSEYWVSRERLPPKSRYHYQYALFSSSGYSSEAQKCAYAHDIFLIPLEKSKYFKPVIDSIRAVIACELKEGKKLKNVREAVRSALNRDYDKRTLLNKILHEPSIELFENFFRACEAIKGALLAMVAGRFPIFLVPNPEIRIDELHTRASNGDRFQIYWDNDGWYVKSSRDHKNLFSFDLPTELFELYAKDGSLSPVSAIDLKKSFLSELQVVSEADDVVRVFKLKLDESWLEGLRKTYGRRNSI